jgi:hypothetical protein
MDQWLLDILARLGMTARTAACAAPRVEKKPSRVAVGKVSKWRPGDSGR